jgi:hypothetical protein
MVHQNIKGEKMFYIKNLTNDNVNWANAYKTKRQGLKERDIEEHKLGAYVVHLSGHIIYGQGFKNKVKALTWLMENYSVDTFGDDGLFIITGNQVVDIIEGGI